MNRAGACIQVHTFILNNYYNYYSLHACMQSIIIMHVRCMHACTNLVFASYSYSTCHTVCPNGTGGSSTIHTVTAFLTALGLTGVAMLFY